MNEDERGNKLPVSGTDPTSPDPAGQAVPPPGQGWQMPEPKFQKSSGYLPQGYLDKIAPASVPRAVGSGAAAAAPAALPGPVEVEPQPDVMEQIAEPDPVSPGPPAARKRSRGARIALMVLGLLGMVGFIALFLGVVYYLFLAPQGRGTTF